VTRPIHAHDAERMELRAENDKLRAQVEHLSGWLATSKQDAETWKRLADAREAQVEESRKRVAELEGAIQFHGGLCTPWLGKDGNLHHDGSCPLFQPPEPRHEP
jgi:hypothetical protein